MQIREYRIIYLFNESYLHAGGWWPADDVGAGEVADLAAKGQLWDVEYR